MFLTIPNTIIVAQVGRKKVNRGVAIGWKLWARNPHYMPFFGAERLVKWLDNKISAVKNELMYQTAKCLE